MLKTSQTIPSSAYRLRELLFRRIHTLRSKLRRKEMALYRRTSNIGFCTLSDNGFENKEMQVNSIPWEPEKVTMKRVHCGACDLACD